MSLCWELIEPEGSSEPERPDETLLSLLEPYTEKDDKKTALFFWDGNRPLWNQRKISYRSLRELVLRFGAGLSNLGVLPKQRVALLLPNSPQFVIAYFGSLANGSIVVPLNPLYTAHEIRTVLKDSGATALIVWDALYPLIKTVVEELKLTNIVVTGAEDALPRLKRFFYKIRAKKEKKLFDFEHAPKNVKSFSEMIVPASSNFHFQKVFPDDIAVLLYTSGTTSDPKGVAHTHASLLLNANACANLYWELAQETQSRNPIFLAAAPFFHIMGLAGMLHLPMKLKAKIVLLPRPVPDSMISAIHYTKSTVFIGVPKMYGAFEASKKVSELASLRICISGAVEIPQELKENFGLTFKKNIYSGYGMSECGITHCQKYGFGSTGSVGAPLVGVEQKILNPDEKGIGEILIRGKHLMRGYWSHGKIDPEKTSQIIDEEGWLHTGDLGYQHTDGELFFVGRIKDMIKGLGGENIYPSEIERTLLTHPFVLEAAVVGIKDKKYGEKIKAFVVLKIVIAKRKFWEKELLDHCGKTLARFKVPHEVICVSSLPKNLMGKVLKKELVI